MDLGGVLSLRTGGSEDLYPLIPRTVDSGPVASVFTSNDTLVLRFVLSSSVHDTGVLVALMLQTFAEGSLLKPQP